MDPYAQPPRTRPRRTFFSTVALGASAVAVTGITGLTGIVLYGMNIADRKTGNLMDCVQQAVQSLPEIRQSLPPVLADALNDERVPGYTDQLEISAHMSQTRDRHGFARSVVEVHNKGDKVVSLLSMRVVVLDDHGDPVSESTIWGATPLAADRDWRGPLMPGATRRIPISSYDLRNVSDTDLRVECEITEIRTWNPASPATSPVERDESV